MRLLMIAQAGYGLHWYSPLARRADTMVYSENSLATIIEGEEPPRRRQGISCVCVTRENRSGPPTIRHHIRGCRCTPKAWLGQCAQISPNDWGANALAIPVLVGLSWPGTRATTEAQHQGSRYTRPDHSAYPQFCSIRASRDTRQYCSPCSLRRSILKTDWVWHSISGHLTRWRQLQKNCRNDSSPCPLTTDTTRGSRCTPWAVSVDRTHNSVSVGSPGYPANPFRVVANNRSRTHVCVRLFRVRESSRGEMFP